MPHKLFYFVFFFIKIIFNRKPIGKLTFKILEVVGGAYR
jgi:hypothetical protein